MHQLFFEQCVALLHNDKSLTVASLANLSSFVCQHVDNINWAGFYLWTGDKLVLGPFAGKVACTTIQKGKGVCGTALQQKRTLAVKDVHEFEGHIACDSESKSELVVPLYLNDIPLGVLDIDSPILDRFGEQEIELFEHIANQVVTICGKNIASIFDPI